MCNEICLTAHVDVALVGTAAQALVQCSTVALLLAAVQLANENVVCPKDFVFAVSAKPVLEQNRPGLSSYSSRVSYNILSEVQISLSYNIQSYLIVHAIFKLGHVRFMLLQKVK